VYVVVVIVARWWRRRCVVLETLSVVRLMTSLSSWLITSPCSKCSRHFSALLIFIFARRLCGFCPTLQVFMFCFLLFDGNDVGRFPAVSVFGIKAASYLNGNSKPLHADIARNFRACAVCKMHCAIWLGLS